MSTDILPATIPCPPWCTLPSFHPYDCQGDDGSWMRDHVAFDLLQPLIDTDAEGRPKRIEVFVGASETISAHSAQPVAGKPVMIVSGVGCASTTPVEAQQFAAALDDASGRLVTALLHWVAQQRAD